MGFRGSMAEDEYNKFIAAKAALAKAYEEKKAKEREERKTRIAGYRKGKPEKDG